ncbi:hypothetical protein QE152_g29094 [Popillia japonica]|uniref:Uncharacterized protein n=1 Tax=Popillia japonica TaxID=7064 RepID=A0AAW1JI26_POPJA
MEKKKNEKNVVVTGLSLIEKTEPCKLKEEMNKFLAQQLQNTSSIEDAIEKRREEAYKSKEELQPFIILCGSLENPSPYIIIENARLHIDIVVKVVDITFKLLHSLHPEYPNESRHVSLFIQNIFTTLQQSLMIR